MRKTTITTYKTAKIKDKAISIENLKDIIEERIEAHRKLISKHESAILNNIEFTNIIEDSVASKNHREAKIQELNDLLSIITKMK